MKIIFHKLARNELIESRDYYDDIIFGLGEHFINEFENSLNRIKENPNLYPKVLEEIRKCNLRIFPFSIYFDIDNNNIRILALSHQKRQPYYWKRRI
ncbi:MAG: plasmid stabilization system [Ignavibacteria bacterium]|nr:plasmid stabilization system [Ignavibacteria bacterium]